MQRLRACVWVLHTSGSEVYAGVYIAPRDTGRIYITVDSQCISDSPSNQDILSTMVVAWLALLDDSPLGNKPMSVYLQHMQRCLDTPRLVIREYAELGDALLRSLVNGERPFIAQFKRTPVFFEYVRFVRTGDEKLLQYILSVLWFPKKLELQDVQFEETAFRGWLDVEAKLSNWSVNDVDPDCIALMKKYILDMIGPGPNAEDLIPKHGPGHVSDHKSKHIWYKTLPLLTDAKIRRAFYHNTFADSIDPSRLNSEIYPVTYEGGYDTAKLLFVPKNYKVARSICMEPTAFQFFQQAVNNALLKALDRRTNRRFIDLHSQEKSRVRSLEGSRYYNLSTIDLSSASDSVALELVRELFPTRWFYYLLATRSRYVERPDGVKVAVKKFAPMGSAVCFPIQCIIFCAAAHATAEFFGGGLEGDDVYRHHFEPTVYGDDIIVDTNLVQQLISLLSFLGFSVNESKSFIGMSDVRESCGIYCYRGKDITPFLFRLPHFSGTSPANIIDSIRDMSARASTFMYHRLAVCIRHLVDYVRIPGFMKLVSRLGETPVRCVFGIPGCTWNIHLQRLESVRVVPRIVGRSHLPTSGSEEYDYMRWQERRGDMPEVLPFKPREPVTWSLGLLREPSA